MKTPDRALVKLQAISGLMFATFLVLHLSNLIIASLGQSAYDSYMESVRSYYQFPLIEIVVVGGASLLHIYASLTRGFRRRKADKAKGETKKPSLRIKFHRYSGYFIFLAFFGHVLATRSPSLIFGMDVDMSFLHFSLTIAPWFFYPYYILLGTCGIYHMTNGIMSALRTLKINVPKQLTAPSSKIFWSWVCIGFIITIISVLNMGGILTKIHDTRYDEWKEFALRFYPASWVE